MTKITEEDLAQVKSFLLMDPNLAKVFAPMMSDDALAVASTILAAELTRRLKVQKEQSDDSSKVR